MITALICSIIGIFIVLTISEVPILSLEPQLKNISDISKDNMEDAVKIFAKLNRLTQTEELAIMDVEDNTGKIKVIFFTRETNLSKNDLIEVTGKVIEYKGELEIEASKIIKR